MALNRLQLFMLATTLLVPTHVLAQDVVDSGASDGGGLGEIIVTAQKRSQNVQKVPVSVAVVGGVALQQQAIGGLAELTLRTPAVKVTEAAAGDQLFIRGVGSGINPGFEQSVGTFIDGVYYGRGRQSNGTFLDVDRVEILKGPQSLYFGNSTIAGAISIASKRPGSKWEGNFTAAHEFKINEEDLQFGVGGPVTDNFGLRVSGRYFDSDGYMRNTYLNRDEMQRESWSLRLVGEWDPTETTNVLFKVDGGKTTDLGNNYQVTNCPQLAGFPISLNCSQILANQAVNGFEDRFDYKKQDGSQGGSPTPEFDPNNYKHSNKNWGAMLNISQDIGDHRLVSTTAYNRYNDYRNNIDVDFGPATLVVSPRREKYQQFSQELRIQSPEGRFLEYLAGVYYQHSKLNFLDNFQVNVAGGSETVTRHDEKADNISAFAALTLNPTDKLHVTLGGRYMNIEKNAVHAVAITGFNGAAIAPATLGFVNANLGFYNQPVRDLHRRDKNFVPAANVRYEFNRHVNVYANYSEGFKAGGFDALHRANPNAATYMGSTSFAPEEVKAYEIGLKSTLANGLARVNVALFRSDYGNLQVSTFNGAGFVVGNAGRARSQGADLDVELAPVSGLTLTMSGTYLDANYREFTTGQCRLINPLPNPALPGACIQTGERLVFAPKWSGAFTANYKREITDNLELQMMGAVNYSSSFSVAADNDPNLLQNRFAKIDARIGLSQIDDGFWIAFLVKNLTDKKTISQGNDLSIGTGSYFRLIDPPRTLTLQVGYRF